MWACNQVVIWLGCREPLSLNLDSLKFGSHTFCRKGNPTFLICHITSREHVIKVICTNRGELVRLSHHSAMFAGIKSCGRENITFLFVSWHHVATWSKVILLYGWKLLTLSSPCATFDAYRSCGRRDLTFLLCHESSQDSIIKGTCDLELGVP